MLDIDTYKLFDDFSLFYLTVPRCSSSEAGSVRVQAGSVRMPVRPTRRNLLVRQQKLDDTALHPDQAMQISHLRS